MAYLGQQPVVGRYILVDDISSGFDGSDTTFDLEASSSAVIPGLAQNLLLSLGGIIQKPGTDYTVSGSVLTFTTAPTAGTTFFATILGDAYAVGTPSDGTVQPASLANTGNFAFPDEIRWLEDSGNGSNYVGFKAAASISSNKIWTLPSADGSAGQYLATDGNGVLSWATDQTGTAGTTLTGSTDNTICTVTGANAIQGEANLTFNGTSLKVGNNFSAHSEGDDLVIGGSGWRGMTIYGEGGGGVIQFADDGDTRAGQLIYDHGANAMSFRVGGNVTRLTLDSTARLGIGVTPYASNVGSLSLVGGTNFWSSAPNNTYWGANTYYNGSAWKYIADGITSVLRMENGVLKFHNSATGSADGNVTLNERLRITADGKFLFGATGTNTNTIFHVEGSAASGVEFIGNNSSEGLYLALRNKNTNANAYTAIQSWDAGGQIVSSLRFIQVNDSNNQGLITFRTRDTGGSETERLRITTGGTVGVGDVGANTPTTAPLYVNKTGSGVQRQLHLQNRQAEADDVGTSIYFQGLSNNLGELKAQFTNASSGNSHLIFYGASGGGLAELGSWDGLSKNLNVNGNVKIATSGKGIDFSATANAPENSPTTNSELFDDYEEGTWTPFLAGVTSAGSGTYADTWGSYTRIGRVVYASFRLYQSAHTGSGGMRLDGLPFTAVTSSGTATSTSNGNHTVGSIDGESLSLSKNKISAQLENANTRFRIMQSDGDMAWVNIEDGQVWLNGTIWYETN